jgi:serine/threonine protein kinase
MMLFDFTQEKSQPIDAHYFLVGTLRDYMGREKYESEQDLVDAYHPSEKKLYTTIDSMFHKSYPNLKLNVFENKKTDYVRYELRSKALKDTIESFYTFNYSGRGTAKEYIDFETKNIDSLVNSDGFLEKYYDSIYTGSLKQKVFETKLQKLSFITGAYIRYGSQFNSLYQISVANSTSKVKILEILLKDLGCTDVVYEIREAIPYGHTVYFTPTTELEKYFIRYLKLK